MSRPTLEDARQLTERLRIFAQPQRLLILALLLEGPRAVSELESETGITQPTLSQQLGALRRSGLITARRESRAIFYSMADAGSTGTTRALLAALGGHAQRPDSVAGAAASRAAPACEARVPTHETGAQFARVAPNGRTINS